MSSEKIERLRALVVASMTGLDDVRMNESDCDAASLLVEKHDLGEKLTRDERFALDALLKKYDA